MQNTMRAHSAGQISMEGSVDVNKEHMVGVWTFARFVRPLLATIYFVYGKLGMVH